MPQWLTRFSEFAQFTEFKESLALFRENPIILPLNSQITDIEWVFEITLIHAPLTFAKFTEFKRSTILFRENSIVQMYYVTLQFTVRKWHQKLCRQNRAWTARTS